jgi:hypothetical protein
MLRLSLRCATLPLEAKPHNKGCGPVSRLEEQMTTTIDSTLTLRQLDPDDAADIDRLSALEGRRAPEAPLLGAEVEGRLLAAVSIATGEVVADPFSRTAELRALLELRAAQLRERRPRVSGRARWQRKRAAPAHAGRLATIHPRAS